MLPYPHHLPSHSFKLPVVFEVSCTIFFNLSLPILGYSVAPILKSIPMPKISIYKNNQICTRVSDGRTAWKT